MKRLLTAVILAATGLGVYLLLTQPIFTTPAEGAEQVVLLHGLGRSEAAMLLLENDLAGAGYEVHNIGYPSNDKTPEDLLAIVAAEIEACCLNSGRTVHFVGHSLGGLLIRAYLETPTPVALGNVVLLGTPNKGSELADQSEGIAGRFVDFAGPTARVLGTGPDDFPASIGSPTYPVGVIAGTRDTLVTNEWLPLPNDSMVSLESARLEGMSDFLAFNVTHWGLRNDADVAQAAIHFLKHGTFAR